MRGLQHLPGQLNGVALAVGAALVAWGCSSGDGGDTGRNNGVDAAMDGPQTEACGSIDDYCQSSAAMCIRTWSTVMARFNSCAGDGLLLRGDCHGWDIAIREYSGTQFEFHYYDKSTGDLVGAASVENSAYRCLGGTVPADPPSTGGCFEFFIRCPRHADSGAPD
jgi:hypothetical protein